MLTLDIPQAELWDPVHEEFINIKSQTLTMEHSLVSISKWESKWHKPFMSREPMTREEENYYFYCMTVSQHVDPKVFLSLSNSQRQRILDYIDDSMTATTFKKQDKPGSREIITSEIIYYWMISLEIPVEFQKWHLNRLLTLIRVCSEKNKPAKKMNQKDALAQQRSLNAARRAKSGSKG